MPLMKGPLGRWQCKEAGCFWVTQIRVCAHLDSRSAFALVQMTASLLLSNNGV